MLSHKQQMKISNPYFNEHYVTMYWNKLYTSGEISKKQWKTLQILADMHIKEQRNYVIIEDELVMSPTNKKTHEITVIR